MITANEVRALMPGNKVDESVLNEVLWRITDRACEGDNSMYYHSSYEKCSLKLESHLRGLGFFTDLQPGDGHNRSLLIKW